MVVVLYVESASRVRVVIDGDAMYLCTSWDEWLWLDATHALTSDAAIVRVVEGVR